MTEGLWTCTAILYDTVYVHIKYGSILNFQGKPKPIIGLHYNGSS